MPSQPPSPLPPSLSDERRDLAAVLEATTDFVGLAEPDGRVLYVNAAGRRMAGIAVDADVRHMRMVDYHPDWAAALVTTEGLPGAERDGIWSGETALLAPDRSEIPVSQVILVHRTPEGAIDFYSTICRDISERKRAEKALRRSEATVRQAAEIYRSLVDNAAIGICRSAPDGRFLAVNPALVRMLGYADEAAVLALDIGRDVYVDPVERQRILDRFRATDAETFDTTWKRGDGEPIHVRLWVRSFKGPDGGTLHYETQVEDITERRQAERAQQAVYEMANAALMADGLRDLLPVLHGIIRRLIPAENLFIALYDREQDTLTFPYYFDQYDGYRTFDMPAVARPVGNTMADWVIRTGQPLLATPEVRAAMIARGALEIRGTEPVDWLGVPMRVGERVIGVLAIQSYDPAVRLGERETGILSFVSTQVAMAIERRRTEDALRASEQRFRSLVEYASDVVLLLDRDGTIRFVSQAAQPVLGFTADEQLGRSAFEFVHPDDVPAMQRHLAHAISKPGQVVRAETRARHLDGRWRTLELVAVNRLDDPAVAGIVVNYRDVTERRQADQERDHATRVEVAIYDIAEAASNAASLKELLECIHTIVDGLMPARNFFIALYDEANDMISFPYFVDEFDSPPAPRRPARGLTEYVMRTGRTLLAKPDVYPELERLGEVSRIGSPSVDWLGAPLKLADRVIGAVVAQTYTEGTRYNEEDARVLEFVSTQIARAIERSQSRERLRESEERYRLLVENSPDAILVFVDQRWAYANRAAAALLGAAAPADLLGRSLFDSVHPDSLSRVRGGLERAWTERGGEGLTELRLVRLDGGVIEVEVMGIPIVFGGRAAGQLIIRDITARVELEQRLRQSQKMEAVGRLAGGVAHDFNNILTVIMGNAEHLRRSLAATDGRREDVDEIRSSAERAARLTRQLLAFSRKQILAPQQLLLREVLAGMEAMLRRLIGEDVQLSIETPQDLGHVAADPGQLEQVILNLVVNARDAMPNGGRLDLSVSNASLRDGYPHSRFPIPAGDYVTLTVRDTGVGMTTEVMAHLFEPFFTTKEVGKGTGLGLATVYGVVKQSGGYVWASSEPGAGATFKVYLPRVVASPGMGAATSGRPSPVRGTERRTILVVEDEDSVRSMVRRALSLAGYTVLEARDAERAVAVVAQHPGPIDLLLTDVVMPGTSGPHLARQLIARQPEMRVLFMSGYADEALGRHGVLEPGIALVQKPFSPDVIEQRVRQTLEETAM